MKYKKAIFRDHPLFALENIYRAFRQCRRGKRGTHNAMIFEQNLEENLVSLHEELTSGSYRPGSSVAFLVEKPKRREIFAADFRDRVVHHILVGYLEPQWERRFICDSYACRKGKGTHKGVERQRSFTRKVTANGTRRAWYLQLDIRGFFISIDRNILYERLAAKERDPAMLWLIHTLVFYEPAENCSLRRTRRSDFDKLPAHKTLFKAAPYCGLPIGNLTSQFFANVYLDALDQFVKHYLKVRYYVRYCDDFILLSEDKEVLKNREAEIKKFLWEKLRLKVNHRRWLRPVSDGIDFLGYIVRPDYLLVRRRVVSACYERLPNCKFSTPESLPNCKFGTPECLTYSLAGVYLWHQPTLETVYHQLNSYMGHFRKAAFFRLVQRLRCRFPWLDEYFQQDGKRFLYSCPPLKPSLSFSQQKARFVSRLPGHILVIQTGKWRELSGACNDIGLLKDLKRFPQGRLPEVRNILWASGRPVAWIMETGVRITRICERALACRWTGRDRRPLALLKRSAELAV
jgi:retron-type reverse transcriptase